MDRSREEDFPMTTATRFTSGERPVSIPAGAASLPGTLAWPAHPSGIVLFAHGSGSGRLSPRNLTVARQLRRAGLGTLLFDLLTETESLDRGNVFDIGLLAERLLLATEWIARQPETAGLAIGYFGASTGAAAALEAAAHSATPIAAVVSRGGRPDLARLDLNSVSAATLLLVGERDRDVLELNRQAFRRLRCAKQLVVIPGTGHLFEEPGALRQVGEWAAEWFVHHLAMERTWQAARA
jgi:putative phosphoribosyl transferase